MRQSQVASSEGAAVSVARKVTVKAGRRDDPAGDEKPGDCFKPGNRRVLVKIAGNKVKVTTDAPQAKCGSHPAAGDEEVIDQVAKRDAASLPQWGQRKRLRFNTRVAAEDAASDLKLEPRARALAKAEKTPTVRIKRPAAAPKLSPELTTADGKRDVEATCVAQNDDHGVTGACESEADAARAAEVHSERPLATPEKASDSPHVGARTGDAAHQDRAASRTDMDHFQWPKFIVSLTRKEKEDDFFAIKGTKLPVRPKKRSKHLEKAVTFVSPGAWLCDITRERYEVKEKKTIKKRPRGLKAMGSADSDTD